MRSLPGGESAVPRAGAMREVADPQARTVGALRVHASRRDRIDSRLQELEREWDAGRALTAAAASLALVGGLLGWLADRRWSAIPAALASVMLVQTAGGRRPPAEALRPLGFRSAREIERERHALKALRGDYRKADATGDKAWEAASR